MSKGFFTVPKVHTRMNVQKKFSVSHDDVENEKFK